MELSQRKGKLEEVLLDKIVAIIKETINSNAQLVQQIISKTKRTYLDYVSLVEKETISKLAVDITFVVTGLAENVEESLDEIFTKAKKMTLQTLRRDARLFLGEKMAGG